MIYFNHLTYGYYPATKIGTIDGVCNPGMLTAIVGSNGSGKSTLLKTVAGILPALSGEVIVSNEVNNYISYFPQQTDFEHEFPITVYDFVMMAFLNRVGMFKAVNKAEREQVYKVLQDLGMEKQLYTKIGDLSGGQLQRVMFARLLLEESQTILLDEPFSGLDTSSTKILLEQLQYLKQLNKAVLVALHDWDMVKDHFDYVIWLTDEGSRWGFPKDILTTSHSH